MAIYTFCRREKKLLVDTERVPALIEALSPYLLADKHNIGGKPYEICNLYLDDEADSVIRHSLDKPDFKEKMRLRSYGTPSLSDRVFLEIKRKTCRVGTKRRVIIPLSDAYAYLETGQHPTGVSPLEEQILREFDAYRALHPVKPRVYISYLRNAFTGRDDPSLRLTLDNAILTRRTDLRLEAGRYGDEILPPGKTLLEVKFSGAIPLWLARIFSAEALSFTSFSKYGQEYKLYAMQSRSSHAGETE